MTEFRRRGITYEILKTEKEMSILKQKYRDDGDKVSSDYFVVGILMPDIEDWVVSWRFDSFTSAKKFFNNINNS